MPRPMHPKLPPPTWRETIITGAVVTLGFALAFILAALHLGQE